MVECDLNLNYSKIQLQSKVWNSECAWTQQKYKCIFHDDFLFI